MNAARNASGVLSSAAMLRSFATAQRGIASMPGDLIRVMLVDDHAVVRAGLKAVLGSATDIDVVGEAKNGKEAVSLAERLRPDVIVMDLSMDEMDGAAATKAIVAAKLECRVLILTMHAEDEYLVTLLEAGASGYLVKSAADRDLVTAVRTVAHGDQYLQASAARTLAKELRRREEHAAERQQFESLSGREREILRLIASGFSAPEIGEQLHISPKTVDTYKQRINEKLGLSHRSDYVRFAMTLGLLDA
jgi:DNA-binding NarL/FixJ family response regulator